VNDIALIFVGSILHAATFAAGISVGIRLRKDTRHDDSNEGTKKGRNWWHTPVSTGAEGSTGCGGSSGSWKVKQANPAERDAFLWVPYRH
jgi:hypothetical protein